MFVGRLWIFALFVGFRQIHAAVQINNWKIVNDVEIMFEIEWESKHKKDTYHYLVESHINKSFNRTMEKNKADIRQFAINYNKTQNVFHAKCTSTYFPSTSYEISIRDCIHDEMIVSCGGDLSACVDDNKCKLPEKVYHHTDPVQPGLSSNNICEDHTCYLHINVKNIQTRNSSLYFIPLKNQRSFTKGFVKNVRNLKDIKEFTLGNSSNIEAISKGEMCTNYNYLLLMNQYMDKFNYTTVFLSKNNLNCPQFIPDVKYGNFYFLFIIPITIFAAGIMVYIKRKSLIKYYETHFSNLRREQAAQQLIYSCDGSVQQRQQGTNECASNKLTLEELDNYLHNNSEEIKQHLYNEFKNVPEEIPLRIYGGRFEDKNRYRNVLPYETNRVILSLLPNKPDSHYINASYIKGYKQRRKYIATQGPTHETVNDFFRMIWEEKVSLVIMLTNLKEGKKEQCVQYWPEKGRQISKNYIVTLQNEQEFSDYTRRELTLSYMNVKRNVTQLHFTCWNESNIPQTPLRLVKFLKEARAHKDVNPILVHCSAGISRTGTFILCDYVIDMAESGCVNFPQALYALRQCRQNMVKYNVQYLYSYCVVNEFLNGNLNLLNAEFLKNNVNEEIIEETLNDIENSDYWIDVLHPAMVHYGYNQNQDKHRINTKEPMNSTGFISLQRYPNHDNESYYTEAVEMLSEAGDTIINTSQPLPSTLSSFYRMVLEKGVTLILSLQELDFNDKTSVKFWPSAIDVLKPVDYIKITLAQETTFDTHNKILIKLQDTRKNDISQVHILHFKRWKKNSLPEIGEFLFYHKMYSEYLHKECTVVACYDATEASSVFLTFVYLVDALKRNGSIDVNTVISTLKIYRRNFNLNKVKLKFIYEALSGFLQDTNTNLGKNKDGSYENLPSRIN